MIGMIVHYQLLYHVTNKKKQKTSNNRNCIQYPRSMSSRCPICLEDLQDNKNRKPTTSDPSGVIALSQCGHEFCTPCLEKWLLQLQLGGQREDPENGATCPQCRSPISAEDIASVLGRGSNGALLTEATPDKEVVVTSGEDNNEAAAAAVAAEEDPDEFTRAYLDNLKEQGQAQQCPGCKIWIVKTMGCDAMTCICGCHFRYCCGEERSFCLCGDDGSYYSEDASYYSGYYNDEGSYCNYDDEGSYCSYDDEASYEFEREETMIAPLFTEVWYQEDDGISLSSYISEQGSYVSNKDHSRSEEGSYVSDKDYNSSEEGTYCDYGEEEASYVSNNGHSRSSEEGSHCENDDNDGKCHREAKLETTKALQQTNTPECEYWPWGFYGNGDGEEQILEEDTLENMVITAPRMKVFGTSSS